MSYPTATSKKIIEHLQDSGIVLTEDNILFITDTVYNSLADATAFVSNGCDCGQMWCPTCHG